MDNRERTGAGDSSGESDIEEETMVGEAFGNPSDEAAVWKAEAEMWRKAASEAKEELEEFQNESRDLEGELETQLKQAEEKIRSLNILTSKLQDEKSQLTEKLSKLLKDYEGEVTELEGELAEMKDIKEEMDKHVRELEQQNDDLERAKRNTLASLEEFEGSMNAAIERNAFLESELDEKENLAMAVFRLKEEARELRSELQVLNPQVEENEIEKVKQTKDNVKEEQNSHKKVTVETPVKPKSISAAGNPPSTPSARISALAIVGNCLIKIGALELKGKSREKRRASQISKSVSDCEVQVKTSMVRSTE